MVYPQAMVMMLANDPPSKRVWCRLARWPLGVFFLYTGSIKLIYFSRFAQHLADFGIVLDNLVPVTALAVCVLEILIGGGLLANRRGSLAAAVGLLCCFIAVLAYGIGMGLDIECGCLGPAYSLRLREQLMVDIGLLGWCGFICWSCKSCQV
jgi:uncharacterized membrane protein